MKSNYITAILFLLTFWSCNKSEISKSEYQQLRITEANLTPTVDIKDFVLITNNPSHDKDEAFKILQVKRFFPLAMQTKDRSLFEKILAQEFVYQGEDEFYKNRTDYIENRINATWTIGNVKYE